MKTCLIFMIFQISSMISSAQTSPIKTREFTSYSYFSRELYNESSNEDPQILYQRLQCYDTLISQYPDSSMLYMERGIADYTLNGPRFENQDFNRSISLDSTNFSAFFYRGLLDLSIGASNEAIADFNKAIELNPTFAYAYLFRGCTHGSLKDFNGALIDFNKSIEIKPTALAYYNKGVAYNQLGEKEHALNEYSTAIKLDKRCAGAYMNRGIIKGETFSDYQGAIEDFTSYLSMDPYNHQAVLNRAYAYTVMNKPELAKKDYEKFLYLQPHLEGTNFVRPKYSLKMKNILLIVFNVFSWS